MEAYVPRATLQTAAAVTLLFLLIAAWIMFDVPAMTKRWFSRLERYLFQPVHAASFVVCRILIGYLCVTEVWYNQNLYDADFLAADYVEPLFLFHYRNFSWIPRLPNLFAWKIVLGLAAASGFGIMAGFLYRISTIVFALSFSFVFLSESSFYLNHLYLFTFLSYVFIFTQGNTYWAIDPHIGLAKYSNTIATYNVYILRVIMSVVYVYAAIAKMNYDWMVLAVPLRHWIASREGAYEDYWFFTHTWDALMTSGVTAHFMAVGGMLYDLTVPFLFFQGGVFRWIGFAATIFFHCSNKMIFSIGIFPYLSLALATIYFSCDWPVRFVNAVVAIAGYKLVPLPGKHGSPPPESTITDSIKSKSRFVSTRGTRFITWVMLIITAQQLLTPLRHHLHFGNVNWNELGHRYSWRMMLRNKIAMLQCAYETPDGELEEVDTEEYLTDEQKSTVPDFPELIEEYAHHLSKHFQQKLNTTTHIPVYCCSIAMLNHRTPQFYMDPRVDLAGTPLWSTREEFIVDLLPRNVTTDHPLVPPGFEGPSWADQLVDSEDDFREIEEEFFEEELSVEDAREYFFELERKGIIGKPMQRGGVRVIDEAAAAAAIADAERDEL